MNKKQHTLKKAIHFSGVSLHSGVFSKVSIEPAPENSGICFQRVDLPNSPVFKASVDLVTDLRRSTSIQFKDAIIGTTEHCLAALYAMQVDNALIKINAEEMPILDGSAKYFTDAIMEAGLETQNALRSFYKIEKTIEYHDEEKGVALKITPSNSFQLEVTIDFNSKNFKPQSASLNAIEDFQAEIAVCKTFCFLHEVETLIKSGLIKGANLDNAIVYVDREVNQKDLEKVADFLNIEEVKVTKNTYLGNTDLLFENEPARHKLLDVIGDLALLGKPILGKLTAYRPGHASNIAFAKKIKKNTNPIIIT